LAFVILCDDLIDGNENNGVDNKNGEKGKDEGKDISEGIMTSTSTMYLFLLSILLFVGLFYKNIIVKKPFFVSGQEQ